MFFPSHFGHGASNSENVRQANALKPYDITYRLGIMLAATCEALATEADPKIAFELSQQAQSYRRQLQGA